MKTGSSSLKLIAILTLTVYFTQIVFESHVEASLWEERRVSMPAANPFLHLKTPPTFQPTIARPGILAQVPLHAVRIKEIHQTKQNAEPTVLVVEDIHMNSEAQRNIALVLESLIKQKAVDTVGVEGAFGSFDFKPFQDGIDLPIVREVADAFLKENWLAAPSYVGITNPGIKTRFVGVDDEVAYRANVAAVRETAQIKKDVLKKIADQRRQLVFPDHLRSFETRKTDFRTGKIGVGEYLNHLDRSLLAGRQVRIPHAHENIYKFLKAYHLEQTLNFARVEHERRLVISKLTPTKELYAQSLAYRQGQLSFGEFYCWFGEFCKAQNISLKAYPEFEKYIRYVILSDGINADKLLEELELLEQDAAKAVARTADDRELLDRSEALYLTEKLVKFELTSREWEKYRHSAGVTAFEQFYQQADIRSRRMVEKLDSDFRRNDAIALVVGGFHTPLITAELKKRGLSYAVVTPKITRIDSASGSAYLSVFSQEKTPLEKLFSGEKLFVAPARNALGSGVAETLPHARLHVAIERFKMGRYRAQDTILGRPIDIALAPVDKIASDQTVLQIVAGVAVLPPPVMAGQMNVPSFVVICALINAVFWPTFFIWFFWSDIKKIWRRLEEVRFNAPGIHDFFPWGSLLRSIDWLDPLNGGTFELWNRLLRAMDVLPTDIPGGAVYADKIGQWLSEQLRGEDPPFKLAFDVMAAAHAVPVKDEDLQHIIDEIHHVFPGLKPENVRVIPNNGAKPEVVPDLDKAATFLHKKDHWEIVVYIHQKYLEARADHPNLFALTVLHEYLEGTGITHAELEEAGLVLDHPLTRGASFHDLLKIAAHLYSRHATSFPIPARIYDAVSNEEVGEAVRQFIGEGFTLEQAAKEKPWEGEEVLDFGTWRGMGAIACLKAGAQVTILAGTTFQIEDLKRKAKRHKVSRKLRPVEGSAVWTSFSPRTFTRVISRRLANLFSETDREFMITESFRVLKPGGRIKWFELMPGVYKSPVHRAWSAEEWEQKLIAVGFTDVSVQEQDNQLFRIEAESPKELSSKPSTFDDFVKKFGQFSRPGYSDNGVATEDVEQVAHDFGFKDGESFEGETVLDVGTGLGPVAISMARHDATVIAVDPIPGNLAQAHANAEAHGVADKITFVEGRAEALPVPNGSISLVTSRYVSHHLFPRERQKQMIGEAFRVLEPGGRILWIERRPDVLIPRSENRLTEDDWNTELAAAGFEDISITIEDNLFRIEARKPVVTLWSLKLAGVATAPGSAPTLPESLHQTTPTAPESRAIQELIAEPPLRVSEILGPAKAQGPQMVYVMLGAQTSDESWANAEPILKSVAALERSDVQVGLVVADESVRNDLARRLNLWQKKFIHVVVGEGAMLVDLIQKSQIVVGQPFTASADYKVFVSGSAQIDARFLQGLDEKTRRRVQILPFLLKALRPIFLEVDLLKWNLSDVWEKLKKFA